MSGRVSGFFAAVPSPSDDLSTPNNHRTDGNLILRCRIPRQ
jgi:hypothetical protein